MFFFVVSIAAFFRFRLSYGSGASSRFVTHVVTLPFLYPSAASCGKLVVKFSNHSTGASKGVTGDSVAVECADGYVGDAAIATCDPDSPGESVWNGMPQCKGG